MKIHQCTANDLANYSQHLKNLTAEDKYTRFCHHVKDEVIDQLILGVLYNPQDHVLFSAEVNGKTVGFGHLAKEGSAWELAVSIDSEHQGKGIANDLMNYMITWGKTHGIHSVFMHCISQNQKIQHLARKHGLRLVERDGSEITGKVDLPPPTPMDYTADFLREQRALLSQMSDIQQRMLANLNPLSFIKQHSVNQ